MFDTHCHIQFNAYKDDAEEVISRCFEKNMILNVVGSQRDTSSRAIKYAEKYDNIYATVGLHPVHLSATEVDEEEAQFISREEKFDYEYYKKLAEHPKVIAIGECGLELFHIPKGMSKQDLLDQQIPVFLDQCNLALELNLPLVIHVRDAHKETIDVLKSLDRKIQGVVHCYTGNWQDAQQYLDLGLHIGFTGIITFPPRKNNPQQQNDLLEVVKKCEMSKILIETDSPYLAPNKYRGKRCEPWMVEEVAKKIAEIRGITTKEVIDLSENNGKKLFNIL